MHANTASPAAKSTTAASQDLRSAIAKRLAGRKMNRHIDLRYLGQQRGAYLLKDTKKILCDEAPCHQDFFNSDEFWDNYDAWIPGLVEELEDFAVNFEHDFDNMTEISQVIYAEHSKEINPMSHPSPTSDLKLRVLEWLAWAFRQSADYVAHWSQIHTVVLQTKVNQRTKKKLEKKKVQVKGNWMTNYDPLAEFPVLDACAPDADWTSTCEMPLLAETLLQKVWFFRRFFRSLFR
ncbi:hypothetical protein BU23DRAFT_656688 [Bimuria novae-zelandiae CBS 107.79]|uniref:Uncharacterized protein n=1 Tax=Bimuria novae-zelandiae CBS 107.79 TaxID=1447943 RepID=A0A6A5UWQ8_9PLEO|nr:hypothetical protein BU23DRAFT_656688 [Bimuria novae-zelandiae CBS 107.79]